MTTIMSSVVWTIDPRILHQYPVFHVCNTKLPTPACNVRYTGLGPIHNIERWTHRRALITAYTPIHDFTVSGRMKSRWFNDSIINLIIVSVLLFRCSWWRSHIWQSKQQAYKWAIYIVDNRRLNRGNHTAAHLFKNITQGEANLSEYYVVDDFHSISRVADTAR